MAHFAGLGVLTDVINLMIASRWLAITVLALVNPFSATYLAGWIFEQRHVHLVRGQSRAFFPGELILALGAWLLLYEARHISIKVEWVSWWLHNGAIIGAGVACAIFLLMRWFYDAPSYRRATGATADSATKMIHDITGYLLMPTLIITLLPPTIYCSLFSKSTNALDGFLCFAALAAIVTSIAFGYRDTSHDPAQMHPDDSQCWYRRLQRHLQESIDKHRHYHSKEDSPVTVDNTK